MGFFDAGYVAAAGEDDELGSDDGAGHGPGLGGAADEPPRAQPLLGRAGRARLPVTLTALGSGTVAALQPLVEGTVRVSPDGLRLHAAVRNGSGLGTEAVGALDHVSIMVDDVADTAVAR